MKRALKVLSLLVVVAFAVGQDVAVCPMAGLVGVPCPSCGLTRSTKALFAGDIGRSWAIHPGLLPVLVYLVAAAWVVWSRRRSAALVRHLAAAGIVLMVCLTVLWGARFVGYFGGPVPVRPWFTR